MFPAFFYHIILDGHSIGNRVFFLKRPQISSSHPSRQGSVWFESGKKL